MPWLIEKDVHEARSHLNLSRWGEYDAQKQHGLLARLAAVLRNRRMPLPRYTLLHPGANQLLTNSTDLSMDARRTARLTSLAWLIVPLPQMQALPGNVRGTAVYHIMANDFVLPTCTGSNCGSAAQLARYPRRGTGLMEAAPKADLFEKTMLPDAQTAHVAEHLASCASCAAAHAQLPELRATRTLKPFPELGTALKKTALKNGLILRVDPCWFAAAPAWLASESELDEMCGLTETSLVEAMEQVAQ
jgi:hypothetical protein